VPLQWVNSSVVNINLTDPRLLTLATAFAPAHLRIGGSQQDDVWYAVDGTCPPTVNSTFCLKMEKWDAINAFAIATGMSISFGLNAMQGRANSTSRFNSTNLDAFLRWTATRRNYTGLWGFTFGNELEHAAQFQPYSQDVLLVRSLIDKCVALDTRAGCAPVHVAPLLCAGTGGTSLRQSAHG
jgi:heparanase